jgi:F0F1-type ATP synthase assembly protein I
MARRNPDAAARQRRETSIGWRMAGLGVQTGSEALAGALLGWVVDYYAGTNGMGLLVGGIVGIVVGLFSLVRGSMKLNREFDQARRSGGSEEP